MAASKPKAPEGWKVVPATMITLDRLDVQLCASALKREVGMASMRDGRYSPEEMDLLKKLYDALGKDAEDFATGLAARGLRLAEHGDRIPL